MASEGNLEAPTRHPLDWKNPDFYDEDKLHTEMERIFDICHGCRRCVNLCAAFPTLFDLVDASPTMEMDGVNKADYAKVVDQCYLCDLCYMTKCPYVPPHEWNLDFPHTMLRAKAVKFKNGGVTAGEKFLASTDTHGSFAGIPIVVQAANAINSTSLARTAMEKTLGVDKNAWLPTLANKKFRPNALPSPTPAAAAKDGNASPGKVALFATCYINYNEPGIGHDLLAILAHNDIPYILVEKEKCCGMPKLELGDLESVNASKEANIPVLYRLAEQGYAILSAIPSCTLMFKQELPLMYPDDPQVQAVKAAMWDPFEYLIARKKDGLLKTDFLHALGTVSYHIPCHGRVQNIGKKTEEMLKLIPGTTINTVERCSGHAGTYGVKKDSHEIAMKIGKPVFKAMTQDKNGTPADYISSDCALAGHHIAQGIDELRQAHPSANPEPILAHPISLVRKAYQI